MERHGRGDLEGIGASAQEIANYYRVFLGRQPDSEQMQNMVGLEHAALRGVFLESSEFRSSVFQALVKGEIWTDGRFADRLDVEVKEWVAARFELSEAAAEDLHVAKSGPGALLAILRDGVLLRRHLQSIEDSALAGFISSLERYVTSIESSSLVGCFDSLQGSLASGWVWNPMEPNLPATVEFLVDGAVIHSAEASLFREHIMQAGYGNGFAGFMTRLPIQVKSGEQITVHARLKNTRVALANSPREASVPHLISRWLRRRERVHGNFLQKLRCRLDAKVSDLKLSIVMPVYNPKPEWLREALDSVLAQWCTRWELVCVNDGSPSPYLQEILEEYSARDERVRVIHRPENGGIAQATNDGIFAASGSYIAFMDHDDILEPDAVYHLLSAGKTGAELVYTDELLTTEDSEAVINTQVRPAFSWDYYLCHPYFVHMVCVRSDVARSVGGWDVSMNISADVDFVLRVLELAARVAHVPSILYRWRTHESSGGHAKIAEVTDATVAALNRHLQRVVPGAFAHPTDLFNQHRIEFPDDHGTVLIVIPTKNRVDLLRPCVDSIRASTKPAEILICVIDHQSDDLETTAYLEELRNDCIILPYEGAFNYARMNNTAVEHCLRLGHNSPAYILFANNDIEVLHEGWLERMRSLACRPDVGVVGASLLYANETYQHSGVLLGFSGAAEHAHKFIGYREPDGTRNRGYLSNLVSTREYSAVTAACMMMRSEVFRTVGGFDEEFAIGFNDTDLCLRIGKLGLKVLKDADTVLHHYESATRSVSQQLQHPEDDRLLQERWSKIIVGGDPFYSPLMSARGPDHQIIRHTAKHVIPRVRPGPAAWIPKVGTGQDRRLTRVFLLGLLRRVFNRKQEAEISVQSRG